LGLLLLKLQLLLLLWVLGSGFSSFFCGVQGSGIRIKVSGLRFFFSKESGSGISAHDLVQQQHQMNLLLELQLLQLLWDSGFGVVGLGFRD